ncbi:sensor histidine kinase [Variovorax sp. J22R115]|uniref:sensor histidine kinase n=1 Tax=Variovorax sp. J22R115 TaxID=3053509 RepID=UPI0025784C0D|nr:ATP-binding protein [Variovorax sp. J22R115]MDM0050490.1 ATP-binding protein [Variovorax sp. J22R115]
MGIPAAWRALHAYVIAWAFVVASVLPVQPARATVPGLSAPELRFDRADSVVSDAREPPADGWQPTILPDVWHRSHPKLDGTVWYRIRFVLDELPAQATALFVPTVAVTGQFIFNGSVLNPQARFLQPGGPIGSQMTNQSHLMPLPLGLFRTGENELLVRVQGNPVAGGRLSVIRMGPYAELHNAWLVREIPQRVIPQALLTLMLATLVFAFIISWRQRRFENWRFVLVTALWTALLVVYLFPEMPLTECGYLLLLSFLINSFTWALLDLLWRVSRSTWRWFPRVLRATALLTLAGLLMVALVPGYIVALSVISLPFVVLRLVATAMLWQWALKERSWRAFALAGAELIWFLGFVQFLGLVAGILPRDPFMLTPSDSLPMFCVLLFFFVERFVQDREQAAREKQAAIGEERERLLIDMHDGLGAQLTTALRLAQRRDGDRQVLVHNIEDALQDLRSIVDSLDVAGNDLLVLLGNLRARLTPRMDALQIQLHWRVEPIPPIDGLTPQGALAVLRVVQEALNNAVRHASASAITISAAPVGRQVLVEVADNGAGLDANVPSGSGRGRGLAGMRKRADRLGGTLSVGPGADGGTRVSLSLPTTITSAEASTGW